MERLENRDNSPYLYIIRNKSKGQEMLKNCKKFFLKDLPIGTHFMTNLSNGNKTVFMKCNKRTEYFDGWLKTAYECKKIVDRKGEKIEKPKWGYTWSGDFIVYAETK